VSTLSPIPIELYSSDLNLTPYCDNIESVPSLRHLSTFVVSQTLVRNQINKDYLLQEYPVQKRMRQVA